MPGEFEMVTSALSDRASEVLERTMLLLDHIMQTKGESHAERLAHLYARRDGLPLLPLREFLRALATAYSRKQMMLDPDEDNPTHQRIIH